MSASAGVDTKATAIDDSSKETETRLFMDVLLEKRGLTSLVVSRLHHQNAIPSSRGARALLGHQTYFFLAAFAAFLLACVALYSLALFSFLT